VYDKQLGGFSVGLLGPVQQALKRLAKVIVCEKRKVLVPSHVSSLAEVR